MNNSLQQHSHSLFERVRRIIEEARIRTAVFVNAETAMLYWGIGNYINEELLKESRGEYGSRIVATLSQQLRETYGKGYTYTALTRLIIMKLR